MDIRTTLKIEKKGLYKEIAKILKGYILTGKIKVGEKIPSENQLCKKLNVSRHTVRSAIEELVREGYLIKKHGKGTFVTTPQKRKTEKELVGILVYKADGINDSPYLKYLTTYLSKENMIVTIYQITDYPELKNLCERIIKDRIISGIVSLSIFSEGDRDLIEYLQHYNIPVVSLGRRIDTANIDWVICDSAYGSYLMTKFLIETGHKKIMLMINEPHTCVIWDRVIGYKLAHINYGLEIDKELIINCNTRFFENSREKAYRKMKEIIKSRKSLSDAIFCVSDAGAIGVMNALFEEGYKVPQNVSVCGFDDISAAELFNLTTIRNPYEEMAKKTIEIILKRLQGKMIIPQNPEKIVLKPEIVIRNSTKRR